MGCNTASANADVRTPSAASDPALRELMAAWPNNPAIVYNIAYDVWASNDIGDALFHNWAHSRNLLQIVFTDPDARTFYRDWEQGQAIRLLASVSIMADRPTTRESNGC